MNEDLLKVVVSPQVQIVVGGRTHNTTLADLLPESNPAEVTDPELIAAAELWVADEHPGGFGRRKMIVARPESGNWLISPQPEYGATP